MTSWNAAADSIMILFPTQWMTSVVSEKQTTISFAQDCDDDANTQDLNGFFVHH